MTRDRHDLWFPIAYGADLSLATELDIYADRERHHLQPAFFLLDPERRIRHISVQSGGVARPPIEEFVAFVSAASRDAPRRGRGRRLATELIIYSDYV